MSLEKNNEQFRKCTVAKNSYNNNDPYVIGHKNALSDGDELGKGEKNGSVGSATDIKTRETSIVKNKYSGNNEYNAGTIGE